MTRSRWLPVAAYAGLAGVNQTVWLTFAPITTASAEHYGVSEGAVGWLSQVFPLVYVLLALPAGLLLDRWLRPTLAAGALLTAAGALLRLGGDGFAWALAGQAVAAVAQPLILNAVTKLASVTLPVGDRPVGIALGSAGMVVGQLLGLLLGPLLADAGDLRPLLLVDAVGACLGAAALLVVLRRPLPVDGESPTIAAGALRTVWADPVLRVLSGLVFVGFGVFIALTTWLQAILEPFGVSDDTTGLMLGGMLLVGVATTALLPPIVARRGAQPVLLTAIVAAAIVGCATLAVVTALPVTVAAVVVVGALLACALPVIFELTEGRSGPLAGTAIAVLWLAGNVGGVVVTLLVGTLIDHRAAAFLAMAAVAACAIPLTRALRPRLAASWRGSSDYAAAARQR